MAPLRVTDTIVIPDDELTWRFSRSGGPGGQHTNTSDTRVELSFDTARSSALDAQTRGRLADRLGGRLVDGVLTVVASENRSQWRNRRVALQRLAELLHDALLPDPPRRHVTKPTRRARARRVDEKKQRGRTKRLRRRPDDG